MRARLLIPGLAAASFFAGCVAQEPDDAVFAARLQTGMSDLAAHLQPGKAAGDANTLVVRLAFGADTDLDLYVTDPSLETIYFANHQSKSGGAITEDRRCGAEGIQVEEVRFALPQAGRYRVGVDYPEHCRGGEAPAAHAVSVTYNGQRLEGQGVVKLRKFDVVVLEFEFDGRELKGKEE